MEGKSPLARILKSSSPIIPVAAVVIGLVWLVVGWYGAVEETRSAHERRSATSTTLLPGR